MAVSRHPRTPTETTMNPEALKTEIAATMEAAANMMLGGTLIVGMIGIALLAIPALSAVRVTRSERHSRFF